MSGKPGGFARRKTFIVREVQNALLDAGEILTKVIQGIQQKTEIAVLSLQVGIYKDGSGPVMQLHVPLPGSYNSIETNTVAWQDCVRLTDASGEGFTVMVGIATTSKDTEIIRRAKLAIALSFARQLNLIDQAHLDTEARKYSSSGFAIAAELMRKHRNS